MFSDKTYEVGKQEWFYNFRSVLKLNLSLKF